MVRLGKLTDAYQVAEIFEDAKDKFKNDGTYQWKGMYPNIESFYHDFDNELVIVYEDIQKNLILGTATIVFSIDKNYNEIDGEWLNEEKYVSIHRIATRKGYLKNGIASSLFKEAEQIAISKNIHNIKIDTHRNNFDMRNLLTKLGYIECGVITLLNRDDLTLIERERIAYQKII